MREKPREAALVAEPEAASLLDVVDNLLNKGVVVTGDVVLGIAGAIDRVSPPGAPARPPANRARGRGRAASRP